MINTSKRIAVRGNRIVTNSVGGSSSHTPSAYVRKTPSEVLARLGNNLVEATKTMVTADANAMGMFGSAGGFGGAGGTMSLSAIGGYYNFIDTLLYGITPEDEKYLRRYYRDIYYYDTTLGSAADLMSTLPFSDWNLTGLEEDKLDIYRTSIERLSLKSILPEISLDYLVNGQFIGSLIYKEDVKQFTDIIPHMADNLQVVSTPFYGIDPMLKLRVPKEMRMFVQSKDPYFVQLQKRLSPEMLNAMSMSEVTLDNLTTLYIPRKTFSTSQGTSIYRRAIPVYLLEKVMYRGTVTEATRRQRSTMLVQMGSEYYEPTDDDLQMLVSMFQQADLDPMGAILATRNDVQVQDIRPAGEFWKWTDLVDTLTPMKLRAIGISEAFLSGDATFNTLEQSLSVFLEHIRSFREMITRKIFYTKLFPLIAVIHGFYKKPEKAEGRIKILGKEINTDSLTDEQIQYLTQDTSKLEIPKVEWHKHLKPEADREYLDILNTLTDHQIPITARTWMAAAGLRSDDYIKELDEDKKFRAEMAAALDQGGNGGESQGGEDEDYEHSAMREISGGMKRVPILSRDFGEQNEIHGKTKTGRDKYIYSQREANRKANEKVAKALSNLSDPSVFKTRIEQAKKRIKATRDQPYGG